MTTNRKLVDLTLLPSYRSDEHDLIRDFYVPCLSVSTGYDRAVGFFSSTALTVAGKGLHAFREHGGKMRLVASPQLSSDDIEAIKLGYITREQATESALTTVLDAPLDAVTRERMGMLAWMIASDQLDVKIAMPRGAEHGMGIYHEKLGIFSDGTHFVAFTGSPNESATALISNFECIDVYCSWKAEDRQRALVKRESFARLWDDMTPLLKVYPFPEAARRALLQLKPVARPIQDPESMTVVSKAPGGPQLPQGLILRDYQREAISNWMVAKGQGVLKMATGSGKTITALAIASQLWDRIGLQALIIVAPYWHLVNQWSAECERFGLEPIRCYESRQTWQGMLQSALLEVRSGARAFVPVITTNATFASDGFQRLLPDFPVKTLFVGDEVHNLGAEQLAAQLPARFRLRLGLSATPERWFDEEGTEEIFRYFGDVVQPEFTLRDALQRGALVPYRYHPVFVTLTEEESLEYRDLTRQISRLTAQHRDPEKAESDQVKWLLIKRSRLLGTAENKLVELRNLMIAQRSEGDHMLFYCGDGRVEDSSDESIRHVEAVQRLLGFELGYRVARYTAETSLDARSQISQQFDTGELQGLVAIRCLDEGVDIPSTRVAYILASSTNPRQFIQRRGRVLRRAPGKDYAEIYDFIVVPPDDVDQEDMATERQMLNRELQRYIEFADLAMNAGEVRGEIVALQRRFELLSL